MVINILHLIVQSTITANTLVRRVIGGRKVHESQFPMLAHLHHKINCGGLFLSSHTVLTAAHCVDTKNYKQFLVSYGVAEFQVVGRKIHPEYRKLTSLVNDIALLYIKPITRNKNLKIAMDFVINKEKTLKTGTKLQFVGWGSSHYHGKGSPAPKILSLTLQSDSSCQYDDYDANGSLCALPVVRGSNLCHGDSGGPLFYSRKGAKKDKMVLVGLSSFNGRHCTGNAVFVRVAKFVGWIRDNMDRKSGDGMDIVVWEQKSNGIPKPPHRNHK